jgi:hypothetical protein
MFQKTLEAIHIMSYYGFMCVTNVLTSVVIISIIYIGLLFTNVIP